MLNKLLDTVTLNDINDLIKNKVEESRTLDYKRTLSFDEKGTRQLLKHISSFANANGGNIIYGISENGGIPTNIIGLTFDELGVKDIDDLTLKISGKVEMCLDPGIKNLELKKIDIDIDRFILIIKIKKSYIAPHRMRIGQDHEFYMRGDKTTYPMDTRDLKTAFTSSLALNEQIKQYKTNKVYEILDNANNYIKDEKAYLIMQFIPLDAFEMKDRPTVYEIGKMAEKVECHPLDNYGSHKYDLNSYLQCFSEGNIWSYNDRFDEYAKYYKNGIIELVSSGFFAKHNDGNNIKKSIPWVKLIQSLQDKTDSYIDFIKLTGSREPIVLSTAMINAGEFYIPTTNSFTNELKLINKNIILFDDIYFEELPEQPIMLYRQFLNDLFNAGGIYGCPIFNEDGTLKNQEELNNICRVWVKLKSNEADNT